jgi:hypothetical protein
MGRKMGWGQCLFQSSIQQVEVHRYNQTAEYDAFGEIQGQEHQTEYA